MDENDDDDVLLDLHREGIAKALPTARFEIYIREVTRKLPKFGKDRNGIPDAYKDGKWFYVELHARELIGWWGPLGIGVVQATEHRTYLHSVLVLGTVRRFGLATRIVEAAGERWPNIYWDGCGASAEFHARLVEKGIAEQREGKEVYDFIPKDKRQQ